MILRTRKKFNTWPLEVCASISADASSVGDDVTGLSVDHSGQKMSLTFMPPDSLCWRRLKSLVWKPHNKPSSVGDRMMFPNLNFKCFRIFCLHLWKLSCILFLSKHNFCFTFFILIWLSIYHFNSYFLFIDFARRWNLNCV